MKPWKLQRTTQCAKCPWKVSTDPHDIPNGYSEDMHRGLEKTIAIPGAINGGGTAMACHESPVGEETFCIGWLVHQVGPGNNILLRMQMRHCENARDIRTVGPQHATFEDTLP